MKVMHLGEYQGINLIHFQEQPEAGLISLRYLIPRAAKVALIVI